MQDKLVLIFKKKRNAESWQIQRNKADELCCVILITETWLHLSILDLAIKLACFTTWCFEMREMVRAKEEGCKCTLTTSGVTTQRW